MRLGARREQPLIGYASNTGTRRNLAALQLHGWRILVTPEKPRPPAGFHYAIDNGAWGCFVRKVAFGARGFQALLDRHGAGADFVIVPDIVAEGDRSLEFSISWKDRMRGVERPLLAVQDGMTRGQVETVLESWTGLGIFLGGSTAWKLRTMGTWGALAATTGRYFHVGRVNTARRIRLCAEAGADSFDGTSASRFAVTVPMLDRASRQPNLYAPMRPAAEPAR
jgi:hypothetical protein